jgi:hypothetical protein
VFGVVVRRDKRPRHLASLAETRPPDFPAAAALISFGSGAILAKNTPIRGFCPVVRVLDTRRIQPRIKNTILPMSLF